MSVGTGGNGLGTPVDYPARILSFTAGMQIPSAVLNAMQDRDVALGTQWEEAAPKLMVMVPASSNTSDSPAPSGGAIVIDVEATSNGTTPVVIDNTVDWRDRRILLVLGGGPAAPLFPGQAFDGIFDIDLKSGAASMLKLFYSRDGQDGTGGAGSTLAAGTWTGVDDELLIYARDTDGALMMVLDGTTGDEAAIMGFIWGSAQQGHY